MDTSFPLSEASTAKFLRWDEDRAKEAYDLMVSGLTTKQIADRWTEQGNPTTRNSVIGLIWRYRQRNGLIPVEATRPPKPKRTPRPRRERIRAILHKPPVPRVQLLIPVEVDPLWIRFMDLEPHHCRWPMGVGQGLDSTYCGIQKKDGSSYCPHHAYRSTNAVAK